MALRLWHAPSRAWPPSTPRRSTRRWSALWCWCSRAWSGGTSIDRLRGAVRHEFAQRAGALEAEIQTLAGEPLNSGSPKQLGDILFGKLGLPGGTKTKTGQWSTGSAPTTRPKEQGHPLPCKILDWRRVSKLKSTYTDALPGYVDGRTHRVHTSYALAATPTGRQASPEPARQEHSDPQRGGPQDPARFIATPGHKLVSADYSQIELRLLAEIADIAQLRNAFREGLDIHAMTASEMFGVPVKGMPGEIRRRAKAINFGIIYGISAFRARQSARHRRQEAGAYIRKYFERFPGIRDYMDETKAFAKKERLRTDPVRAQVPLSRDRPLECVDPLLQRARRDCSVAAGHRRRHHPPRDGAHGRGAGEDKSAQMLLQVHDELVFEVPEAEVAATLPVIQKVMEQAPMPAPSLAVPLAVDARAAHSWDEAH